MSSMRMNIVLSSLSLSLGLGLFWVFQPREQEPEPTLAPKLSVSPKQRTKSQWEPRQEDHQEPRASAPKGVPRKQHLKRLPKTSLSKPTEELPFTASVFGRIVNAESRPLGAVIVRLQSSSGQLFETRTLNSGTFDFSNVEPGSYRITVRRRGGEASLGQCLTKEQSRFEVTDSDVRLGDLAWLFLEQEALLSGTVYSATGDPVKGATVRIHFDEESHESQTNESGHYSFNGMEARDYTLIAYKHHHRSSNHDVMLEAAQNNVHDLVLDQRGLTIHGRVFAPVDRISEGLTLTLLQVGVDHEVPMDYSAPVNAYGDYKLEGIPAGQYVLFLEGTPEQYLSLNEDKKVDFDLSRATEKLNVRLAGFPEGSQPLVRVSWTGDDPQSSGLLEDYAQDSEAHFTYVAPGKVLVEIEFSKDSQSWTLTRTTDILPERVNDLRMAHPSPKSTGEIEILAPESSLEDNFVAISKDLILQAGQSKGKVVFSGLPPGPYQILLTQAAVVDPGDGQRVSVEAGKKTTITFTEPED